MIRTGFFCIELSDRRKVCSQECTVSFAAGVNLRSLGVFSVPLCVLCGESSSGLTSDRNTNKNSFAPLLTNHNRLVMVLL